MKILKGILAGLISVVVGAVVIYFGAIVALRFIPALKGRSRMFFDLEAMSKSHLAWLVAIGLFLFGFIGELRRN